jgi:hypothetical protein
MSPTEHFIWKNIILSTLFVASCNIFCPGCSMTPLVTVALSIGKQTRGVLISTCAIYVLKSCDWFKSKELIGCVQSWWRIAVNVAPRIQMILSARYELWISMNCHMEDISFICCAFLCFRVYSSSFYAGLWLSVGLCQYWIGLRTYRDFQNMYHFQNEYRSSLD